jgi:hypothetical protein
MSFGPHIRTRRGWTGRGRGHISGAAARTRPHISGAVARWGRHAHGWGLSLPSNVHLRAPRAALPDAGEMRPRIGPVARAARRCRCLERAGEQCVCRVQGRKQACFPGCAAPAFQRGMAEMFNRTKVARQPARGRDTRELCCAAGAASPGGTGPTCAGWQLASRPRNRRRVAALRAQLCRSSKVIADAAPRLPSLTSTLERSGTSTTARRR